MARSEGPPSDNGHHRGSVCHLTYGYFAAHVGLTIPRRTIRRTGMAPISAILGATGLCNPMRQTAARFAKRPFDELGPPKSLSPSETPPNNPDGHRERQDCVRRHRRMLGRSGIVAVLVAGYVYARPVRLCR